MSEVDMDAHYVPSGNVVARVIEGELIIVPLIGGIGDMDDELYSVNATGKMIWERLNRTTSLIHLVQSLADEYTVPREELEKDVRGFVGELLRRKMVIDARTSRTAA